MTILELKEAVRERDGRRCTDCGMTEAEHLERHGTRLEVHRVVPGSDYTLEGTVALCKKCHGFKPRASRRPRPPKPVKVRIALILDGSLARRVDTARRPLCESITGYIRRAIIERLERDESSIPPRPAKS